MGGCARVASSTALKAITVTCAHAAAKDAFNAQIEEPGSKEETAPSHRQALAAYAHNESEQRMLMCNMERSLSTSACRGEYDNDIFLDFKPVITVTM